MAVHKRSNRKTSGGDRIIIKRDCGPCKLDATVVEGGHRQRIEIHVNDPSKLRIYLRSSHFKRNFDGRSEKELALTTSIKQVLAGHPLILSIAISKKMPMGFDGENGVLLKIIIRKKVVLPKIWKGLVATRHERHHEIRVHVTEDGCTQTMYLRTKNPYKLHSSLQVALEQFLG